LSADVEYYYEVLGLDADASAEEVKQAWRDLAQVWHPDRFAANERLRKKAQEKLKEVNEAYEALKDIQGGKKPRTSSSARRSRPGARRYQTSDSSTEEQSDPLSILKEGVHAWNVWRKKYSNLTPNLVRANLAKFDLEGADLRDIDLSKANLKEADLYKADLSGAHLRHTVLSGADLSRSTLIETQLVLVNLTGADLSAADLSGAKFEECILTGVNFVGAILEGTDLASCVGMTRNQIAATITDTATRLPPDLR
jgi:hypothetical protein